MRTRQVRFLLVFFVSCMAALVAGVAPAAGAGEVAGAPGADDWQGWRGPNGDGTSLESGFFPNDRFALEIAWKRVLGRGYSGVSVSGGRLATMFSDGESNYLVVLDAGTGSERWRRRIGPGFPPKSGSEGGPSSVPFIDEGVIYALGPNGRLLAARLEDGAEVWSMRVDESFGAPTPYFGFATSPLVVGDLLFVQVGASDGRGLVGFDKRTGRVEWSIGSDSVSYQSPVLATLAGRDQLIAVTDQRAQGLAPESGTVLWSLPHGLSETEGHATPVPIDGDRFLLAGRSGAVAFEVRESGSGYVATEIWRSSELKASFATPVFHEGFVYGFSGEFLTCVSARDGSRVWRSRPPGGRGLILLDGRLVIFGAGGALVVAEASPDGYEELSRAKIFGRSSSTYPSFANGTIFVRDTREIAAVKVVAGEARVAERSVPGLESEFARFVDKVERSRDKKALIDSFMEARDEFPIIEDGCLVHFVYRGEAEDIGITGSMTELKLEEPMTRIEGTDLFHRTYSIEPGVRWEYVFKIDFEQRRLDPLNPLRAPSEDGEVSVLAMPGWRAAEHLEPYRGGNPGRLESFVLDSEILATTRRVDVYLPPGYKSTLQSYPVAIFNGVGDAWLRLADLPNSLNHLIGRRMAPVIAVLVKQPSAAARDQFGGPRSGEYVSMLADELLPYLDAHYRTIRGPASRAVLGVGNAGMMAVYAALERPEIFGRAGGLSVQLLDPLGSELMNRLVEGGRVSGSRFFITWNRYELRRAEWGLDLGEDSRRLVEALTLAGHDVEGLELLDSAGWGAWRAQVAEPLVRFFPLQAETAVPRTERARPGGV